MIAQAYHNTATQTVTRPHSQRPRSGPLPLRVYLVLKYLRAVLTPGVPIRFSNATICEGVGYRSEGEVSQILRWLAGDQPLTGRWAHRYLDQPQRLRYLRRERRPDGGYTTTLLAIPEPIMLADSAPLPAPDAPPPEHHPPLHDPFHDLCPSASEPPKQLSRLHDPLTESPSNAPECLKWVHMPHDLLAESASDPSQCTKLENERDHAIESESNQIQQQQQRARPAGDETEVRLDGAVFVPWAAIQRANLGFTLADLHAADTKIRTRVEYDREQQLRVLFSSLLQGQLIYSRAEIVARRAPREHPPHQEPPPRRRTPADPYERWRHIAPPLITAEDQARTEQLAEQARQIAPPDSDQLDVVYLMEQLEAGATAEQALARLADYYAAEARQPSSDEVYRELIARSRRAAHTH